MVCVLVVAIYFNSCHFILHLIDVNEHTHTRDKSGVSGERDARTSTCREIHVHTYPYSKNGNEQHTERWERAANFSVKWWNRISVCVYICCCLLFSRVCLFRFHYIRSLSIFRCTCWFVICDITCCYCRCYCIFLLGWTSKYFICVRVRVRARARDQTTKRPQWRASYAHTHTHWGRERETCVCVLYVI